jgi:hypothetical protein
VEIISAADARGSPQTVEMQGFPGFQESTPRSPANQSRAMHPRFLPVADEGREIPTITATATGAEHPRLAGRFAPIKDWGSTPKGAPQESWPARDEQPGPRFRMGLLLPLIGRPLSDRPVSPSSPGPNSSGWEVPGPLQAKDSGIDPRRWGVKSARLYGLPAICGRSSERSLVLALLVDVRHRGHVR